MRQNFELRYASHPDDFRHYDTSRLRKDFVITNLMVNDEINMVYTMYDRYIGGGAVPKAENLTLQTEDA
jgi:4-deoxy-L-threo-5-hexosulose-uronate ketol-isomerase